MKSTLICRISVFLSYFIVCGINGLFDPLLFMYLENFLLPENII